MLNGSPDPTFEQVRLLVAAQLVIDEDEIRPESTFTSDLGADSLDIVELMLRIEEYFGVAIPDEDALTMVTVSDLVNFIDAELKPNDEEPHINGSSGT